MHTATHNVYDIDASAGELGSQAQGAAVGEGKAVENGTRDLCRCLGSGLARIVTNLRDAGRDIAGRKNIGSSGSKTVRRGDSAAAEETSSSREMLLTETLPGPH